MIQTEQNIPSLTIDSTSRFFTELSDVKLDDSNLNYFLLIARTSAVAFAKRKFKNRAQFVDESIAEANFWLVVLFVECKETLFEHPNTVRYIRSKISYKLQEYWAPYATSTMSYVKAKGEVLPELINIDTLEEENFVTQDSDIECFICLESIMTSQLDWDIYEQKLLCKTPEEIASQLNVKVRLVRKTLSKIKKRLKQCKPSSQLQTLEPVLNA